jgi:hypothetical protein
MDSFILLCAQNGNIRDAFSESSGWIETSGSEVQCRCKKVGIFRKDEEFPCPKNTS